MNTGPSQLSMLPMKSYNAALTSGRNHDCENQTGFIARLVEQFVKHGC